AVARRWREGISTSMDRRDFVAAAAAPIALGRLDAPTHRRADAPPIRRAALPACQPSEIEEAAIATLQQWMEHGCYSARSILDAYQGRIGQLDRAGPSLHAMIELNPDAQRIADDLDAERRAGSVRGPLHGIPLLIKDN